MTMAEASSYQRLREHLAYLGMPAAAEHLSNQLDRSLKEKLSATQVLETLLEIMVQALQSAHLEGTAQYKLRTYTGPSVLVIDELGYLHLDQASANWIFQFVSRRYERASVILTSNRGSADWGQVFADAVVATAIVDRLLHCATVLNVRGRSYRMRAHQDPLEGKNGR